MSAGVRVADGKPQEELLGSNSGGCHHDQLRAKRAGQDLQPFGGQHRSYGGEMGGSRHRLLRPGRLLHSHHLPGFQGRMGPGSAPACLRPAVWAAHLLRWACPADLLPADDLQGDGAGGIDDFRHGKCLRLRAGWSGHRLVHDEDDA